MHLQAGLIKWRTIFSIESFALGDQSFVGSINVSCLGTSVAEGQGEGEGAKLESCYHKLLIITYSLESH